MSKPFGVATRDETHRPQRTAEASERDALVRLLNAHRNQILDAWKREFRRSNPSAANRTGDGIASIIFDSCVGLLHTGECRGECDLLSHLRQTGDPPVAAAEYAHHAYGAMCMSMCSTVLDDCHLESRFRHQAVALIMNTMVLATTAVCKCLEQAMEEKALLLEGEHSRFLEEVARVATRNRLRLVPVCDIPKPRGEALAVREPLDGARLRHTVIGAARAIDMPASYAEDLALAVGEAVANVLKHAGEGVAYVWDDGQTVYVRITDVGNGITTVDIPKAFTPGWSSGPSLGMGFTLMLEMADALWMATSEQGTTVCIEKSAVPPQRPAEPQPHPPFSAKVAFQPL